MYHVTSGVGVPWTFTVKETVSFSEHMTSLYVCEKIGGSSLGFFGFSESLNLWIKS